MTELRQQREGTREPARADATGLVEPLLWPFAAAKLAMDACTWWLDEFEPTRLRDGTPLTWTTPNRIVLELRSMRLRDFSRHAARQPVLICAPYAQHSALIADFSPQHSIVEALQQAGLDRVHVTDWRSATPEMRYLSIDDYLADLNVAVDEIGPPVDLVGLCQGGWLSLVYAARWPQKVRRLVLVGAPVDVSVPSELSRIVASTPPEVFKGLVGRGDGVVHSRDINLWSGSLRAEQMEAALQQSLSAAAADAEGLLQRFKQWDREMLELPGAYYLEAVNWIFRENRIAAGSFVALGRQIDLAEVKGPVFLLAGADDKVVPPQQAFATARLLGTPDAMLETASEPCGHLGLFVGRSTLGNSWRRIARWLRSELADCPSQELKPPAKLRG